MKDLKHTPGPWAVGYASPESKTESTLAVWQANDLEAGYGSVICKVSPELTMNETDQANAKLIATAPELLEACQTALNICSHKVFPTESDLKRLCAELKAVLTKATE